MRILGRLLMKLVTMVLSAVVMAVLLGSALKHGSSFLTKVPGAGAVGVGGLEAPKFSSDETDLMSTVFTSALKLFTGQASRKQLSGELSDKLYGGRDKATDAELGIEYVSPGGSSSGTPPEAGASPTTGAHPGASSANSPTAGAKPAAGPQRRAKANGPALTADSAMERLSGSVRTDLLGRVWVQVKLYWVELSLIPVMMLGMNLFKRVRRRGRGDDHLPSMTGIVMPPPESELFELKHEFHSLGAEEFELLVALIYQRQGYRISMPSALGSGRGGDFTLLRKGERVLVQCKRADLMFKMPVERVQELHEAMTMANIPRGIYVASCGFSWDARNYAKGKGITVINARTLDELITAARETPEEDLLAVPEWAPQWMGKVQLTAPQCPSCDAPMDQINTSAGTAWVCSQRPDCRGRRVARKYQKGAPAEARKTVLTEEGATQTVAPQQVGGGKPAVSASETSGAKPAVAASKGGSAKKEAAAGQEAGAGSHRASAGNAVAANEAEKAKPRSRTKLVEKITHEDPARQAELEKLAELARERIKAKRAAQGLPEEEPAAPVVQPSPSKQPIPATTGTRVAPKETVRKVAVATPGNRSTPVTPVRQVTQAPLGNRPTTDQPARQVVPGTPGNRPTTNQARQVVPATPGNRTSEARQTTSGN
jgi:ssDNA-binding Zn-finger/Zn-ribbon topoisomerase 1